MLNNFRGWILDSYHWEGTDWDYPRTQDAQLVPKQNINNVSWFPVFKYQQHDRLDQFFDYLLHTYITPTSAAERTGFQNSCTEPQNCCVSFVVGPRTHFAINYLHVIIIITIVRCTEQRAYTKAYNLIEKITGYHTPSLLRKISFDFVIV
ncbi:hypothetical protein ANN_04530 [Periplaneta americana]|uniref:Uncharacterized protein n=1 Tax=Periplaneta americana TaxID=6978 RepID=A0ABQ8T8S8_PERAM|nr:hypothetical protein ANN_04530 [Periplaneta americana]